MFSIRRLLVAAAALAVCLACSSGTATAATVTFNIWATFTDSCPGCTLSGTVELDPQPFGGFSDWNVTMSGQPVGPLTMPFGASFTGGGSRSEHIHDAPPSEPHNVFHMFLPLLDMSGLTYIPMCTVNTTCALNGLGSFPSNVNSVWFIDSGYLTITAPVPLPAALPLFATVLAGGGLIASRRKRKAAKARDQALI